MLIWHDILETPKFHQGERHEHINWLFATSQSLQQFSKLQLVEEKEIQDQNYPYKKATAKARF